MAKRNGDHHHVKEENIAVAIDKDKGSQYALKWAVDRLLSRGQSLTLIHVKNGNNVSISDVNDDVARTLKQRLDSQTRELFLPFRCFCTRKDIKCNEVILDESDIVKALIDYVSTHAIENLVLGASSRNGLVKKFKNVDIPGSVSKGAPAFCNVYVIAKGKISSVRAATTAAPVTEPHRTQLQSQFSLSSDQIESSSMNNHRHGAFESPAHLQSRSLRGEDVEIKSPFTGRACAPKFEPSVTESDISFVSSGRPSVDRMFPSFYEHMDYGVAPRLSSGSEYESLSSASSRSATKSIDMGSSLYDLSSSSIGSGSIMSWSSQSSGVDDVEAEMRRLRIELKQTMDMYSAACKEALTAKQKAREFHRLKLEEQQRLEEARIAEEAALALAQQEKVKATAALEAAEAAQKLAELEVQKRKNAEMSALKEAEAIHNLAYADFRYRKYTIDEIEEATEYFASSRKIGEGGYGPVYKGQLDHTPVAIKVLRPDAAQGRSQFQQEVEVLCNIRHPNMVLLLGACPAYGCLVYEYMANGSLEDRIFRRGNTPVLPWQLRFRIAAEIGTGLLFLHQTKPEPLVHRDLKPANILLDRNYVSKIGDVGLARLIPPSIADTVTQYRMTSAAGTFCYIDPEYQQTGMLGIKSDIYSLGIMLLQLITAKPPMGLTHHVERAIEMGSFAEILDPAVPDWPLEETLAFAKIALQCAELRRKDRPDLGNVVLPALQRLRSLAEDSMPPINLMSGVGSSPNHSQVSTVPDLTSDPSSVHSGDSFRSRSST